jgi:indolepyruvate ferredoxin oxidoreductase, beta subunit
VRADSRRRGSDPVEVRPITIAIAALGGQGGGVLADWIRELAEQNGYFGQSTSVPGVAQRTGSTVYYLELFSETAARAEGREPVLSLSAVAGDVDVVIAAEWMEAGRAVQRGFVTPDRTVLIASTHRAFAISEKSAMGDGVASSEVVMDAVRAAARRLICFDMQKIAEDSSAMISAALFGSLGASAVLPFPRAAFEAVIAGKGLAASANRAAFEAAWAAVGNETEAGESEQTSLPQPDASAGGVAARIRAELPSVVHATALEGCRQLIDHQDERYAIAYLARLERVVKADRAAGGEQRGFILSVTVARHLAVWMAYQDVIRVADQKTRAERYATMRSEVRAAPGELAYPVEYMHPRLEELCDILPRRIGAAILGSTRLRGLLQRPFGSGRLVRTYNLGGFLLLFALASLRPLRPMTLRYAVESERIESWLDRLCSAAAQHYDLAIEIARCPRLLKGYSDTHARGWNRFSRIMDFVAQAAQNAQTARAVARLHDAALAGEDGAEFDAVLTELGRGAVA